MDKINVKWTDATRLPQITICGNKFYLTKAEFVELKEKLNAFVEMNEFDFSSEVLYSDASADNIVQITTEINPE